MKNRVNPVLLPGLEMYPDQDLRPECLPTMREKRQKSSHLPLLMETLSVTNEVIEGPDANPLRLKIYRPKSNNESLPALLWIHGGGYILGSINDNDDLAVKIAKRG
ncbi:alpha/beta hydrolase [Bacillus pacificus]